MTHWPFVAASYLLGVLVPLVFGLTAFSRMGSARRRLAAMTPGSIAPGAGPRVTAPPGQALASGGAGPRVDGPGAGPRRGGGASGGSA